MRNNCPGIVAAESSAAVARVKGSGRRQILWTATF